jgi:hypothetical protein
MNQIKSVRFELTEEEKNLLASIAEQDGRAGMSATIRRLIRNEAFRRNIDASAQPIEQASVVTG